MAKKTAQTQEQAQPVQEHDAVIVSRGEAAKANNWRNIRLIIGREYKNRVTQRSFLIASIILLLIVFLAAFVPTIVQFFASRSPSQTSIVVVNHAGTVAGLDNSALTSYINTTLNGTNTNSPPSFALRVSTTNEAASLQSQVKAGKLDMLLVVDRSPNQDLHFTYYSNGSPSNDSNLSTIQTLTQQLNLLDNAHRLGLTLLQTRRLFAPPDLSVDYSQQSQNTKPSSEIAADFILAFVGVYLLFYAVTGYAGIVAQGVAEEKSSRVMEILVNAATPFQLMVGKILGIGAAGLSQMVCLVVVGVGAQLLQTPIQAALFGASAGGIGQYLIAISLPFYLLFLVYFLLAFFLYATLFAGLGAMVKRQDEVQSAIQVPLLILILSFVPVYMGAFNPNATSTKVFSYIPFWMPMVMLIRLALGAVAWWEVVVTIVLLLVTIFVCVMLSARIYRYGVLMYGQRPGFRQLLKMVRAK